MHQALCEVWNVSISLQLIDGIKSALVELCALYSWLLFVKFRSKNRSHNCWADSLANRIGCWFTCFYLRWTNSSKHTEKHSNSKHHLKQTAQFQGNVFKFHKMHLFCLFSSAPINQKLNGKCQTVSTTIFSLLLCFAS